MKNFFARALSEKQERILLVTLIILAAIGYSGYRYYLLRKTFIETSRTDAERIHQLEDELAQAKTENENLTAALQVEQGRVNSFAVQFGDVQSTVSTLEKLSRTDPQLLQKYSKVYFLNENYVPAQLSNIDLKYLFNKDVSAQIHTLVLPYLTRLIDAAAANGAALQVVSAYRSFGTQSSLKLSYRVTYGTGANKFSADQGYSEHQLGTTVDFTTPKIGTSLSGFEKTPEYQWLTDHAYQYGFVLSYPKDNAYYIFEPWHWRFVGVALATRLHNENKYFYDLDQREIDAYRANMFE